MRTIRLLVVVLALALSLPFAVVLRSHASNPPPTEQQITEGCDSAIREFALQLMLYKARGVPREFIIETLTGSNAPNGYNINLIKKLVDALYDDTPYTQADFDELLADCVAVHTKRTARKL